jgi:type III pantothenate kinase
MLLAIDIGNTHTVIGVFKNEHLVADWRIATSQSRTADETWHLLKGFWVEAGLSTTLFTGAGISSVVPNVTGSFETLVRKHFKVEPVVIGAHLDLGMTIKYDDPSAVGADRLCNAVAGYRKYGGPLIIIDFGTATTYDVVGANGDYQGGVISLGLESTAAALHRRAAKLPNIELHFPLQVIGQNTPSSMQAGVMFGAVDAVEGMVRRIQSDLRSRGRVIATGGLSSIMAKYVAAIEACEPTLVLDGIRLIWERVKT